LNQSKTANAQAAPPAFRDLFEQEDVGEHDRRRCAAARARRHGARANRTASSSIIDDHEFVKGALSQLVLDSPPITRFIRFAARALDLFFSHF
jgi:hypothetical protein